MLKTESKVIDGIKFNVTQFPGRAGVKLAFRIFKEIGPAFASAAAGIDFKGGKLGSVDFLQVAAALEKIGIGPDAFCQLLLDILAGTRVEKDGSVSDITGEFFDMEFGGNLGIPFRAAVFALEVNYGSFFGVGGIGSMMMNDRQDSTPPNSSPKT